MTNSSVSDVDSNERGRSRQRPFPGNLIASRKRARRTAYAKPRGRCVKTIIEQVILRAVMQARWAATDPEKARPTDPRRRHRRAQYGELARTGPLNSRSTAEHKNGRRVASRERLRFLLELQVQRRQRRPE